MTDKPTTIIFRGGKESALKPNLAFTSIFADSEWMFKTGLGGIFNAALLILLASGLLAMPLALAFLSLLCGYFLRVLRLQVTTRQFCLPPWDNWLELFYSGLTWLVIQVMLAAGPLVLGTIWLGAMVTNLLDPESPHFFILATSSLILLFVLSLFLSFLTPYLMLNFALKEELSAGFAFQEILERSGRRPQAFVCAWLLSIGLGLCAVILPLGTLIGIFFLPTSIFLAHLLSANLAAQAWLLSDS